MSRTTSFVLAAVAGALVVSAFVTARPAAAQELTWQVVETAPGEPTEKVKNPPPVIKLKVIGEPAPKPEEAAKFLLKQVDAKLKGVPPIPSLVVPYHKSNETLALVVLVEGHEFYFGNDKYVEEAAKAPDGAAVDPNAAIEIATPRSAGVYDVICGALDAPGAKDDEIPTTISRAGPLGSKGALLVYSIGVDVRYPMGDLKGLTCDKLGPQEMQKDKRRRDFVDGLRESHAQLKRASASRKVLFIISDGFDGTGTEEIKTIKKALDADKIDVFAFQLEADSKFIYGDDATKTRNKNNMQLLGTGTNSAYQRATDAKALAEKITAVVQGNINNRFWMTFPGQVVDPKTKLKSGFTWDEKEHELMLERDGTELSEKPVAVVLAPKWGQAKGGGLWWLWIAIPGGVLLLGVLIMAFSGKKQPAPMPVMQPLPVAAPPAPIQAAPAAANRTMAINISGGDGVPVVGWLVPINGPQSFQTFKCVAGVTKVGNAAGAHIVINDGFMSGEHAHIAMSPTGFTLIDNNSTNGTYVNERRVQRHELIDNDVIKFGKTDCKFKTILG